MENGGVVQKVKIIPLWARIISWSLGLMFLVYLFTVSMIGFMKIGLDLYQSIQAYGTTTAISIFTLGVCGGGLFLVIVCLALLIVKRITKWKWLQIPM